jgi:hypothetical protein
VVKSYLEICKLPPLLSLVEFLISPRDYRGRQGGGVGENTAQGGEGSQNRPLENMQRFVFYTLRRFLIPVTGD